MNSDQLQGIAAALEEGYGECPQGRAALMRWIEEEVSRGARRIRKKSYAKVLRASVGAETSRLPVCGSAARRNRRLG